MFLKYLPSGPLGTNCIIIACPDTHAAAIIDAPLECVSWVLEQIAKEKLIPKMILLTHSHWDHIADLASLKKKTNLPVYVHKADQYNVEKPGADGLPLMFPIEAVVPEHNLEEGQILHLGTLKIQIIHTPGHSAGCVCFWLPEENVLISGDTLFRGSIGNLSFKSSRPDLMPESLQKLCNLPEETKVIPGHGPETKIKLEKRQMQRFM